MRSQGWGLHPPGETGENHIINSGMSGDEPGRVGQISSKDSLGAGEQGGVCDYSPGCGGQETAEEAKEGQVKVPRGRPGCRAQRNCLCFTGNRTQCGKGRMRWELPKAARLYN